MPRKTTTLYSPPVGCRLIVKDQQENKEIIVSTLSVRDHTSFKHRTPKGTEKGEEYFYVKQKIKGQWHYIKMLNSLLLENCHSEDGRYIFEGKMPDGRMLPSGKQKNRQSDPKPKSLITTNDNKPKTLSFVAEGILDA